MGEEEKRKGEEEKMNKVGGGWQYIKQYFRRNYRRKLIAVGGIKFRR